MNEHLLKRLLEVPQVKYKGGEYQVYIQHRNDLDLHTNPFGDVHVLRGVCQVGTKIIDLHVKFKDRGDLLEKLQMQVGDLHRVIKEKVIELIDNPKQKQKEFTMNYKRLSYVLAVEATNQFTEYSTEEEMLEAVEDILELDKKAKVKMLKVYAKVEPTKVNVTKLLQEVEN